MWKKIFIVLLSLALLGCNHADEGVTPETTAPKTAVSETTAAEDSPDVDNAISEGFASAPFWDLAERDSLAVSDEDIKDVPLINTVGTRIQKLYTCKLGWLKKSCSRRERKMIYPGNP